MTDTRQYYLEDLPLDEAQRRLRDALRHNGRDAALSGELVPLPDALGRVTAEALAAKLSSPHYHAAAVDGYAVRAAETSAATETRPIRLRVGESAFAVDTGDAMPANSNAVVMVEHSQAEGEEILLRAALTPWQHVRLMGEDMVATEWVLPANHTLRPVDLGALAGCGYAAVAVRRRPRVVIIPTGDELVAVGTTPQAGQIIEYNSLVLAAQIKEAGGLANVLPIIPDQRQQLQAALDEAIARQPDLILMLSGSSAGREDFTADLVQQNGTLLVHGVAVRPGHPVIIGAVGAAQIPLIGVPGYPVSAALTGEIFILPLLARWLGQAPAETFQPRLEATLTRKLVSPAGDDDFVRVSLAQVNGRWLATPLGRGAGVITSLVRADGLAHIPRFSEGVDMGGVVSVKLYRPLETLRQTLLLMGSHDPLLDLFGQNLSAHVPNGRLVSTHVASLGGLVALRRGEAHLAGSHLFDPDSNTYNWPTIHKYLAGRAVRVVTFAHREQGLMVAHGNPLGIQSLDDVVRVRYVNRQTGAGTRVLLDYELARRGIRPEQVTGYSHEEYTHLGVAAAVASGLADCGMGVRSGAVALGLDFIPVTWERYDWVIPAESESLPLLQAALEVLNSAAWRALLAAQAGYDGRETGQVQPEPS